jgi:hypothetical protein
MLLINVTFVTLHFKRQLRKKPIHKSVELRLGKVKVKLSLYHAMKAYWGSGIISPCIIDLVTIWRRVVRFTPLTLYPPGKSPWYSLHRRLGGL